MTRAPKHSFSTLFRSVPQLPGKQLIGRFKDSFLKQRQEGLERFLNRFVDLLSYKHVNKITFMQKLVHNNEKSLNLRGVLRFGG